MLFNNQDFPDTSHINLIKKTIKKNKEYPITSSVMCSANLPPPKKKNLICRRFIEGKCLYGDKCNFAHYKDDWCIENCSFANCNRFINKNVDPKNKCLFFHKNKEDLKDFYKRLNIDANKIIRPSKEDIDKSKHYSKLCDSYLLGEICNKPKDECHYAHSVNDLILNDCSYEDKCKYFNKSSMGCSMICMFNHNEQMDDYLSRVSPVYEERKKIVIQQQAEKKEKLESLEPTITKEKDEDRLWADIMEDDDIQVKNEEPINKEKLVENEEPINKEKPVENEGKIVIEVSKENVVYILKIMIENKVKNFELKIVN